MNPSLIRVDLVVVVNETTPPLFTEAYVEVPVGYPSFDPENLKVMVHEQFGYARTSSSPTTKQATAETTKKHRGGRRKGQPTWVESITAALGKKALGTAAILKNMEAAGVEINVDNPKRYIGHLLSVHSKGRGAPFARVRGERGVYRVR